MKEKRSIRICLKDKTHKDLEISKATLLDSNDIAGMMHLDQLRDGTWRLMFSSHFATDFTQIERMEIVRS